jgi:sulfur-oxidizing protein SoxY
MAMNRIAGAFAAVLSASLAFPSLAGEAWDDIAANLYGDRPIEDGSGFLEIDAPDRAHDAAIVPITVRATLPDGDARRIERMTLVVDENPAPVAGTFSFGTPASSRTFSTRVRVNAYSPVRVVAELSDGTLYARDAFVKAAGGCAAPALKDADEALAALGEMRFRDFGARASDGRHEAQVMVRHPNSSGFQRDPITLYYIPARFVDAITVRQGDEVIFAMDGGISISEDPSFRFDYAPNGQPITVEATDTDGAIFTEEWPSMTEGL